MACPYDGIAAKGAGQQGGRRSWLHRHLKLRHREIRSANTEIVNADSMSIESSAGRIDNTCCRAGLRQAGSKLTLPLLTADGLFDPGNRECRGPAVRHGESAKTYCRARNAVVSEAMAPTSSANRQRP